MKKDDDDFEYELRLHWHQHFRVEVRIQAVDKFIEQALDLSIEAWSVRLVHYRADKHAVRILQ